MVRLLTARQPRKRTQRDICANQMCQTQFQRSKTHWVTYHRLCRDRLEEVVDNLRKGMRADFCSPYHGRIPLHAFLPTVADTLHSRYSRFRSIAFVVLVIPRTHGHFYQNLAGRLFGFLIHVRADGGPKSVDHVDDYCDQEEVEDELGVVGEDMGKVGVGFEIAEEGRDNANFVDFGGRLVWSFTATWSFVVFAFVVGILVQARAGDADVLLCSFSLALVDSTSHDIVARSSLDLASTGHAVATKDT